MTSMPWAAGAAATGEATGLAMTGGASAPWLWALAALLLLGGAGLLRRRAA